MKSAVATAVFLSHLASFANAAYVAQMDIASCADLQSAAGALSGGNIEGVLVESEITCDDWTTVEISQNKLKLTGQATTFTSVRFVVADGAILRVDTAVEFTGDQERRQGDGLAPAFLEAVNGGVLNVAPEGYARFLDSVKMYSVGVNTVEDDTMQHGGCIYNEGYVRFEGTFTADACRVGSTAEKYPGNGGALWNGPDAKVVFKEAVEMTNCYGKKTEDYNGRYTGLEGGAVYTEGKISFYEDAVFTDNEGDEGGAMWIGFTAVVKFLKRSKATFARNTSENRGGHIMNEGVLVMRNTAVFEDGVSGSSGGAINAGDVSEMVFIKHVDFIGNSADAHGGAIATTYPNIEFLPQDATYEGNVLQNADYDYVCPDVYVNGSEDGGEDGYICLP
ncbi:unnamed protein product [Ectocarpus sp. 8 AP-2014]